MKRSIAVGLMAVLGGCLTGTGQEWTRFRGPNGTGIAQSQLDLSDLSRDQVAWHVALPGGGHCSPVIWGRRVFLTSMDTETDRFFVLAVETGTGEIAWSRAFPFRPFEKHRFNSFASPSCAVDAQRVYASWATPDGYLVAAFTHQGKTVWERDLGPFKSQHGVGVSPIVFEGKVVLANDQLGESFLIALDAPTGETRWRTARSSAKTCYSTPCVLRDRAGESELIFNSMAHGLSGVDPKSGRILWEYPNAFDKRTCSSPFIADNLVFGSCGSGGGGNYVVAIRPPNGVAGKAPELAYEIRRSAPYVPTGVYAGGWVYLWSDAGILTCLEPATGSIKFQERTGGRFFASPIVIGDQLLNVSTGGQMIVVAVGDTFHVRSRFDVGELCHSTPAVAEGKLYVRTRSHLWKFESGGP